jgi:hypothetical protein
VPVYFQHTVLLAQWRCEISFSLFLFGVHALGHEGMPHSCAAATYNTSQECAPEGGGEEECRRDAVKKKVSAERKKERAGPHKEKRKKKSSLTSKIDC